LYSRAARPGSLPRRAPGGVGWRNTSAGLPSPHSKEPALSQTGERSLPAVVAAPVAFPDSPVADAGPGDAPWTWSWLRWREGEGWTLFWVAFIHVSAVVGVILFPVPGLPVFLTTLALTWLGGLGTTVAYHRALAHKSVRLRRPAETVLTAAAIFNGSGSPASWVANHRLHHARADGPGDISSPRLGGFWWAHLRWLWQAEQGTVSRWAPDMDTPYYRFFGRWQILICAVSFLVGAPFGWAALVWLGPVRLVFSLHAQCFVNSIAHMREDAMPGEDSSQNIPWLGALHFFQGENWHANHHAQPRCARIGRTPLQLDAGWWVVVGLERVGLASGVCRPRPPAG
jgi:fatty-acid desaturase